MHALGRLLAAVTLAATTAACSTANEAATGGPEGPPELDRLWEMPSDYTIPQAWGDRLWFSDFTQTSFDAAGARMQSTGLKLFDAATGESLPLGLDDDTYACAIPTVRPDDDYAVFLVTSDPPLASWSKADHMSGATPPDRACTGITVVDLETGEVAWSWPVGSRPPMRLIGSAFGAAMLEEQGTRRRIGCFDLADGRRLAWETDEKCVAGEPYATPLLDEYGGRLRTTEGQHEIARIDGVRLLSGQVTVTDTTTTLVRATDLETGLTLWARHMEPAPEFSDTWDRTETYGATGDSLLHIRYEFPDSGDETAPPVAVISRVDPRTGEEVEDVGTVGGGWFLAQVGDVTVMGVDQELGWDSRLAGFRIPSTSD